MNSTVWTPERVAFREIADYVPFMVWMTDEKGYCFYLNPGWLQYTGQTLEQGQGDGWVQAVHPDDRTSAYQAFFTAWTTKSVYHTEYRLHRAGDGYRWVAASGRPYFDADGNANCYVGSVYSMAIRPTKPGERDPVIKLTAREREVLELTASGKTAEDIGIILGISSRTVEEHIRSSIIKTNATNKVQAVVEALRLGEIAL